MVTLDSLAVHGERRVSLEGALALEITSLSFLKGVCGEETLNQVCYPQTYSY